MRVSTSLAIGGFPALGHLIEPTPPVRPAEGKLDRASLGQGAITDMAVDLQHAAEPLEMLHRVLALAIVCIDIGHRWWRGSAQWATVPGKGPELPRLGPASFGIKHGWLLFLPPENRQSAGNQQQDRGRLSSRNS
jgi:hypothetical protein